MKHILLALLCLLHSTAWAATYWVDAVGTGTGDKTGSSVANQCAGTADADCTAAAGGDLVYLCNPVSTVTLSDSGTSNTSRLSYDTSCLGGVPMEVNGADAQTSCLIITGSHLNVNGVPGDPWNPTASTLTKVHDCVERGIMIDGAVSNVTVSDFETYDHPGSTQSDEKGAGSIVDNFTSPGTTSPVSNILFEDIYSHDNGAFGFATSTSGAGITCRRCRLDENGARWHGGGAFIHPYRTTVTSGWTVVSGDVYSRATLDATDDVDVVYWITQTTFLTDIGTCGTPSAGQFCYTPGAPGVGVFRVNLGVGIVPNGQSIQYRRGPLTGVVIEDSGATGNIASDGTHGAGFQPDDLAGSVTVRRSYANNNEGAGFKAFRNQGTIFESVLAWNNGLDTANSLGDQSGLHTDESSNTVVRHATLVGNNTYGFQQGSGTSTVTNSILASNDSYGARAVTGSTTFSYVDIFGNVGGTTTTVSGGALTNNNGLTSDPTFVGGALPNAVMDFCLKLGSPLANAGAYTGAEVTGLAYEGLGVPPAVGALGLCRPRLTTTRETSN